MPARNWAVRCCTIIMILFPEVWRCPESGTTLSCKNKVPFLKTILRRSYRDVCREIPGIIVCPIGLAYEQLFDRKGAEVCSQLYTDNRHPSLKASYLASCMEYAVIFQESPLDITYVPQGLSETDALAMRELAESALSEWDKEMRISR